MSENDHTTNLPDRPHAEVSLDWSARGAPGVTAESFDGQQGVPAYFALAFRDGARPTARRLFTIYVDARDGERLAERLEAAADVLRSRRLDGVRPGVVAGPDATVGHPMTEAEAARLCAIKGCDCPGFNRALDGFCSCCRHVISVHVPPTPYTAGLPGCDCADSLEHASGRCATRNPSPNNSEEADRDDA